MIDVAKVLMFGKPIATIHWEDNRNVAQMEYDSDFVGQNIEPAPLTMPARRGVVYSFPALSADTYKGLPGMLADSLPDTYGRALFGKWLTMVGRTSANPVETLCFMGKRCMGALEFSPAIDVEDMLQNLEIGSLVDVARQALVEKNEFSTNLDNKKLAVADILRLGTSAGGQRAKAIIAYNQKTGEIRSGQVDAPDGFDYYIIKLDGVSAEAGFRHTENFCRLEYSFYKIALMCGIDMSESSLIEENGRAHFLTKRFDRKDGKKIHMQTLCGLAHYDFHLPRAYSYEQAFGVMRALKLPYPQILQMFRRMVFNVVARNQDDHTKNISFLMDEHGTWSLAPAYDMEYAYNPRGRWTSAHQMSVGGKYDSIGRHDLLKCAEENNIIGAAQIIDSVAETLSAWPQVARDCGVPWDTINAVRPHLLLNI